jgi:hypothetical protein
MSIKKIIQEELDSFEWAKDVPTGNIFVGSKWTHRYDGWKNDGGHGIMYTIDVITDDEIEFSWGTPNGNQVDYVPLNYFNDEADDIKFHNGINESEFDWADDVRPFEPYVGMKWKVRVRNLGWRDEIYEITKLHNTIMELKWENERGGYSELDDYELKDYWSLVDQERVRLVGGLNESEFEWIDNVEPFNLQDRKWIIRTKNQTEWEETEQWLYDNRWYWYADERSELGLYEGQYHYFFPDEDGTNRIDAANEDYFFNHDGERLDEWSDARIYEWSDIKPITLTESEFEWIDNVESMKLIDVSNLEDGKYYVFHGKKDVIDAERPDSPPPDWVFDYEGQVIQVISNNIFYHKIEFIPHGNIKRTKWKEDTESVTLDYMAQMFIYGEFSELQGSLTESEFDWVKKPNLMDNIQIGTCLTNTYHKVTYRVSDVYPYHGTTSHIIEMEPIQGFDKSWSVDHRTLERFLDDGTVVFCHDDNHLVNESEFDWAEKIPTEEKLPHWSGYSDRTAPGFKRDRIFIYTDENGVEHSVKNGGTKFLGYDGVGGVSFYDSSITQNEIDNLNRYGAAAAGDPFEGKFEVEMTRPEYNNYIRDGRIKLQIWDNFYPINESEFDWAKETPEGYDVHEKKKAIEFGPILNKVFEGTNLSVDIGPDLIGIIDESGIYLDWEVNEVLTINDIINEFRKEVNSSMGDELREEYREVYMLLLNFFKNN